MTEQMYFQQGEQQNNYAVDRPSQSPPYNTFARYLMPEYSPAGRSTAAPESNMGQAGLPPVQIEETPTPTPAQQQYMRQWAPQNFIQNGPEQNPYANGQAAQFAGQYESPYPRQSPYAPPMPYSAQLPYAQMAETLAREQGNGHFSPDMIRICNQIWHNTHNPRDIYQLVGRINGIYQQAQLPFMFVPRVERPPYIPFGVPAPSPTRMSIDMTDRRNPYKHNRIFLQ